MNYITDTTRVSTSALYSGDYIAHHGIKGQKWGVRRYQNEDGTLTAAGRRRYNVNKVEATQREIDSFKGYENGVRSKSGKLLLSAQDVKDSIRALEKQRDAFKKKGEERKAKDDAKIARKEFRAKRNEAINASLVYDGEFDITPEGQRLLAQYEKEIRRMENDPYWDDDERAQRRFDAAERAYLTAQGQYTVENLLKKYSDEEIKSYFGVSPDKFAEDMVYRHAI